MTFTRNPFETATSPDFEPIAPGEVIPASELNKDDAYIEYYKQLHNLRDAVNSCDLPKIQAAAGRISEIEKVYPDLAPETDQYTERDN